MIFKNALILQFFSFVILISESDSAKDTSWIDSILSSSQIETLTGQIIEQYTLDDKYLLFFSQRTNWYEASAICNGNQGVLAILNSEEKANTISRIMGYSNIHNLEKMWIGGYQKSENDWRWSDDSKLPRKFPPWARSLQKKQEKCLVINKRLLNHNAVFVDLNCYLPKPFICERDIQELEKLDKLPPKVIETNSTIYYLYYHKLSWNDAVAFCRLRDYRLAVVPDAHTSKNVARVMLKSRPTLETAWIGGHEFDGRWIWVSTGEKVEDEYLWAINAFNGKYKCGAFDRHMHEFNFIRQDCDKRMPFICEKSSGTEILQKPDKKTHVLKSCKKLSLTLFLKKLNWNDAFDYCHKHDYYLGEIQEDYVLNCISEMMKEHGVLNLWLGGKYMEKCKIWQWEYSHYNISTSKDSLIPWSETVRQKGHNCLNLDYNLPNRKIEAYSLDCYQKQSFLCIGPRDERLIDDENECY